MIGKATPLRDSSQRQRRIEYVPKKEPGFVERLQTAAKAKKAQLEKMRATVPANSAQSVEQQAGQVEAAAARKVRTAERKYTERVAAQRKEALRVAEKARQAQAVIEENARKGVERIAQAEAEAALKRDQKAARDAKYAARKARQK
jgi:Family of unknown function (DUF6481)